MIHIYRYIPHSGGLIEHQTADIDPAVFTLSDLESIPLRGWPTPAMRQTIDDDGELCNEYIGVDVAGRIVDDTSEGAYDPHDRLRR